MATINSIRKTDAMPHAIMRHRLGRQQHTTTGRVSTAAAYTVALLVLTLLSLWRIPARDQGVMWAEDGNVFILQALEPDSAWTPFQPYAGYLHFVPRVLIEVVVRFFPVAVWANVVTVLACLAVAAVALITFHCAKIASDQVWIRAAWAAIPVFVNVAAIEPLGNFANLHWYFLWLAPWLLIKPAKSIGEGMFLFAVAAAGSLTEIISILFVPLFLYRLRDKQFWAARAGLALGLACQAYTTLAYPRGGNVEHDMNPLSVVYGWFLNTSGPIIHAGSGQMMRQIVSFGSAPVVVSSLLIAAAVSAVLIFGGSKQRWLAGLFIGSSMLVWVACVVANPAAYLDYAEFSPGDWLEYFLFTRYSVVPTMFVLAVFPLLAQALSKVSPQAPVAVGIGFAVLLTSMYFVSATRRDGGPVWADQAAEAELVCAQGHPHYNFEVSPPFYKGTTPISCTHLMDQ